MEQIIDISKTYTLDEYIKIDEIGDERHEYFDGKLITMPGESLYHNQLCFGLAMLLHTLLKVTGYQIFVESVKLNIEGEKKYVYPDITIIKNQPEENLPYKDYIIYEPLLIVEILSDSTRKYDLTDKFILYQKSSTLQYYLAVESEKPLVIFYEKNNKAEWVAKTFTASDEIISLPKLNATISLKDIYQV
ncbi:MAG: Uma2 family endonuclease [Chitinophagaceae bacterium]